MTVTVLDKNDCPPSFRDIDRKYTVSEELAPGQQVATVKASDPDLLGTLSYILLDGGDGNFELESSTGVIRLKEPLDRERKDLYSLTVQASDGVQQTETILEIMVKKFLIPFYFFLLRNKSTKLLECWKTKKEKIDKSTFSKRFHVKKM